MYTAFFGLTKKPFNMTPDPAFLYLTDQHREALAGLTYAILDRKGFLALSGMAGSGKTTLLSWVLQKLPASQVQSSVILNPSLTPEEFLEMAMLDFGISEIPDSKARRIWKLHKFLLQGKLDGKVSVLIVDEAHKLTPELLEEIRLLGNFECADEKLLQVLLIGQSELDDVLNRPDLWQFKQRLSIRLSLKPLAENEVERYLKHRWMVAGGSDNLPFSGEAIVRLAKWSKGIPRLINSICDSALVLAFADASSVGPDHIDEAAKDLRLMAERTTAHAPTAPATKPALAEAVPSRPRAAATAPEAPAGVWPVRLRTIERYGARQSFLGRWASKFGLA